MNFRIIMLIFISLIQCTLCSGQKSKDWSDDELEIKANLFIEKISDILNEGDAKKIKSELLVNKSEFRHFLDQEWKRKYSNSARKKMKDKFEPSVEKGWKEIQRNDGYYLVGSLVKEVDLVSKDKIINPTWINAKFSEINVTSSEGYDTSKGEISMLKLINIHAKVVTDTDPIYIYKFTLPCILTSTGDLKIVGFLNGLLISTESK